MRPRAEARASASSRESQGRADVRCIESFARLAEAFPNPCYRRAARLSDPASPPDQRSSGTAGAQSYCVGLHCSMTSSRRAGMGEEPLCVGTADAGCALRFLIMAFGKPG